MALAFGRPVEELRRTMPASEFAAWGVYRDLYGPVNLHSRLDHHAATIAWTVSNRAGGTVPYEKFLKYPPPSPFEEDGLNETDRQAIAAFEGASRRMH